MGVSPIEFHGFHDACELLGLDTLLALRGGQIGRVPKWWKLQTHPNISRRSGPCYGSQLLGFGNATKQHNQEDSLFPRGRQGVLKGWTASLDLYGQLKPLGVHLQGDLASAELR